MAHARGAEHEGVHAGIDGFLHDRAIVWLRAHLRGQRSRSVSARGALNDAVVDAATEGRLLAIEHVGAISPDEVAWWRQRLRDAAVWQEPAYAPVAPEVRDRAISHLGELASGLAPTSRDTSPACFSAVAAYEQTGVLTADEALAWRERVRAQIGVEPERPPRCSRQDLLRVISGPAERQHGLRVTSVELYADGVVVHWHHARRLAYGPATPRVWSNIDIETAGAYEVGPESLIDDLGTRYLGGGGPDLGINGGGWVVRFGASVFTPVVPADARRLRVQLHDGGIDVDL